MVPSVWGRIERAAQTGSSRGNRIRIFGILHPALGIPPTCADLDQGWTNVSAGRAGSISIVATLGWISFGRPIHAFSPDGRATSSQKNAPNDLPVIRRTTSPTRKPYVIGW
jgi:hypothetical protein